MKDEIERLKGSALHAKVVANRSNWETIFSKCILLRPSRYLFTSLCSSGNEETLFSLRHAFDATDCANKQIFDIGGAVLQNVEVTILYMKRQMPMKLLFNYS